MFSDATSTYSIDNNAKTCTRTQGGSTETFPTADLARGPFAAQHGIDAACVRGEQLFLVSGTKFVRYTLSGGSVPDFVDPGYPRACSVDVDALVVIGGQIHVFSGDRYGRLAAGAELDTAVELKPIQGNWGNLPYHFRTGLDAAGATAAALYLFRGERYVRYPTTAPSGVPITLPYEITSARYEIIRLTTGTAVTLNQRLLAGGVPAVLATSTQETDETPAFDKRRSSPTVIKVQRDRVDDAHLPVSSHLDFDSANGIYYWEAFFHAPLLIAQAFNEAQRFAEAKQWYEYVFDPTRARDSWRFLPFRAVDVGALVGACTEAFGVLDGTSAPAPAKKLVTLLEKVGTLAPVFTQEREVRGDEEAVLRRDLPRLAADLTAYVTRTAENLRRAPLAAPVEAALASLEETQAIIARLERSYDLMVGGLEAAVRRYLDDPFDPHAIAAMRPGAYRRAVVMAYIDNLLDWGDMLFRQYTAESIDEARMLYLHAYDLLGERPRKLGSRPLRDAEYYGQLRHEPGEYDMLLRAAVDSASTAPHSSAAPPEEGAYFVVPENAQLGDYWSRVEDRLRKIRQSQDILGVGRPLPLFEPPIDPAALVAAVASGLDVSAAAAAGRTGAGPALPLRLHAPAGPGPRAAAGPARQRPAGRAGEARRRGAHPAAEQARGRDPRVDPGDQGGTGRHRQGQPGRAGRERGRGQEPPDALPAAPGPGDEPARAGAGRAHDLGVRRAPGRGRPEARRGHRARVPPVQDRPVHRGPRDRRRPGRLVHRQVLRVLRVARRGAERHRRGPRHLREPPADGGGLGAAGQHRPQRPRADRPPDAGGDAAGGRRRA